MEEKNEAIPVFDIDNDDLTAKIKVIGVGGGGSNAVNQMINDKKDQIEYWVLNTDSQALGDSPCENKYVLGKNITKGLGAGGKPENGRKAAEDSIKDIKMIVDKSDLVFIACGEGGGTGTGAAPIIAKASKEAGALVLAVVTRPFTFEGKARQANALEGINELKKYVDALIVVSNDKLVFNNGNRSLINAFKASDGILAQSVKTITDLILLHGTINLDLNDLKSTLTDKGIALIGIGSGEGENKAIKAAQSAINSPLLEASIKGSKCMLINITAGESVTLDDVQNAIEYITEAAGATDERDANIIFGVQTDKSYTDKMQIAIIATDFTSDVLNSSSQPQFIRRPSREENRIIEEEKVEEKPSKVEIEMTEKKEESPFPEYLKKLLKQRDVETDVKVEAEEKVEKKEVSVAKEDDSVFVEIPSDED